MCLPCCVCGPSAAAPAVHHSRDHGGLCGCRADCEAARGGRGERQAAERPTPLSQAPDQHAAHAASKHTAGTARMACALSCMCVPSAACRLLHGPSVAACANSAEGLAGRIFLIAPAGIGYVADSMSPPCCHTSPTCCLPCLQEKDRLVFSHRRASADGDAKAVQVGWRWPLAACDQACWSAAHCSRAPIVV